MSRHAEVYRGLVRLYPSAFRHRYADDLVQSFDDLLASLGPARAWRRTALDLVVTAPRYQLEMLMSQRQTTTTLAALTVALAATGVVVLTIGVLPVSALLLIGAVAVAVAVVSRPARVTRTPDPHRRRHFLTASAFLAATCVLSTTAFWIDLSGDDHWPTAKLVVYNACFLLTSVGALVFLVAGLLSPRTPADSSLAVR